MHLLNVNGDTMRADLLLILLGILGFFAHSIRAKAVKTNEDTQKFPEALKEVFGEDNDDFDVEKTLPDRGVIKPEEVLRMRQKLMNEVFEESDEKGVRPVDRSSLDDIEFKKAVKTIFEVPPEEKGEPVVRRYVDPREEKIDRSKRDHQDEAKSLVTSHTSSNENGNNDSLEEMGKITIGSKAQPDPQDEDDQSEKLRRALDTPTPDPYKSIDWSKHDLQDEAESWERSGTQHFGSPPVTKRLP